MYYDPNRQLTQQLNIMLNQLFSILVPYHFTASRARCGRSAGSAEDSLAGIGYVRALL